MTLIPFDLIRLVIDHVDNARTLFSLLTLNKAVFPAAAGVLYRDPLWPNLESVDRLIDWLLTLSPMDDEDTRLLRQARGLPPGPSHVQPALDYLQFIRSMRWDQARFSSSMTSESFPRGHFAAQVLEGIQEQPLAIFIRKTVSWAACCTVLENIRHLYVEANDIPQYTAVAARLQSVRTIYVNVLGSYDDACDMVIHLVKAIHQHHGSDRLLDCRLSLSPFSSMRRALSIYDMTNFIQLSSLLPKPRSPLRIPRTDGTVVVLDRVFDRYLAELTQVDVVASLVLQHHYTDLTVGQRLQRFRSLNTISLVLNPENSSIFEWAADEAQLRKREQHSPSPSTLAHTWMPPAIPVKSLHLTICDDDPPDNLHALRDALNGFATTLQELILNCEMIQAPRHIEAIAYPLTHLRSVEIHSRSSLTFHPSLWTNFACIETLVVDISDHVAVFNEDFSRIWPEIRLPSLKTLKVEGDAGRMFNLRSLYHMPKLESLKMSGLKGPTHRRGAESLKNRWRGQWSWPCPKLKMLDIEVDPSNVAMELEFLRTCPLLGRVVITVTNSDQHPYPLKIKPKRASLQDITGTEEGVQANNEHDRFLQLHWLKLGGPWAIDKDELSYLINHMFPRLFVLIFEYEVKLVDCTDADFVRLTKSHPWILSFHLSCLRRTLTLRELGLDEQRRKMARSYHFANGSGFLNREKNT